MFYIYKITNKVNGKVYIGLTTETVEKRWLNHVRASKKCERHLYKSMRKYGVENFKIEVIDETDDFEYLGELERKYIAQYNSTDQTIGYNNTCGGERNQLDGNPRALLSIEDVENIRMLYGECKLMCSQCWKLYEDRISFSAFEKIFEGITWKTIMPEVYNAETRNFHKQHYPLKGELNGNALLSDNEVLKIREYYVNHTLSECFNKFGKKFKNKTAFRNVIDRSYKHLPVYNKIKKMWINYNKE